MALAMSTTDTTPTTQPASWDSKMGSSCFLMVSNWR